MTGQKKRSEKPGANDTSSLASIAIDAETFTRLLADQSTLAMAARGHEQQGSLSRVGDKWILRWRDVADENGHRPRKSRVIGTLGEYATRPDAWAEVLRIKSFLIPTGIPAGKSPPFQELCQRYIDGELRGKSSGTIRQYRSVIQKHLLPEFGDYRVHEISAVRIRTWMTIQLEAGSPRKTIKTRRDYLMTVLAWAESAGFAAHRPAAVSVRVPRARSAASTIVDRAWLNAESEALLAGAIDPLKTMFAIYHYTGLRGGECLALDWSRIDTAREIREPMLRVRATAADDGTVGAPKTKASVRDVPIPKALALELRDYHLRCGQPIGGLLFPGARRDQPRSYSGVLKILDRLCANLGVQRRGRALHAFRHRYAQNLADAGTPPAIILELCGWSDLASAGPYLRASGRSRHAAVERSLQRCSGKQNRSTNVGSTACPEKSFCETPDAKSPRIDNGGKVLKLPKLRKKR